MKSQLIGAALALGLAGLAGAQVTPPDVARQQAQELRHGDPARWYRADQGSKAELATLRKEIQAALREALEACKQQGADSSCAREARATYRDDMAHLQEIRLATRELSRSYETSGK